ncbi:MFS transporter [Micromonospora sp. WMMC241]|uniref:MFS transporter n=1 Tax=Micromonospora sp. WMMC241 TaxID=3015159 RepID=UPI0022B66541|nr:MFS transporter [Micromonospora sp. WMMC241]MCZ7439684.1 MFS transporter [Micromonospora sp. WMMC241]
MGRWRVGRSGEVRAAVLSVPAFVGASMTQFAGSLNLLPRTVEQVTTAKVLVFGVLIGVGALVSMTTGVLVGHRSDRTGDRRPWIVGGTVLLTAGLTALPHQGTVGGVVGAWVIAQLGWGTMHAGVSALVPDHVPPDRLGTVSAYTGLAQFVGAAAGTGLAALPGTPLPVDAATVALAATALILPAATVGRAGGRRAPGPPPAGSRYGDFWWAWLTRFTAALSNSLTMTYLLYYLTDVVRHPNPTGGQFVLVLTAGLAVVLVAPLTGHLSDRWRRRKRFVIAAMAAMAAGELILAALPWWGATVVAATVFGLGYGTYLAVDQALVIEVLPDRARLARDLGLLNVAGAAPGVVGPPLAAALLAGGLGYAGVYVAAALVTAAGIAAVPPIRRVR